MKPQKKLQIFVSSTYTDLREERQAAVEAILTAGHIPAGMELFAASDQSQMNVIRRWIDESDAFMLILGGRYGSLEPQSQKSYIHLEYEYAMTESKPLFAVVTTPRHLEEKVKAKGLSFLERDNTVKYDEFKALVQSKMVRFWSSPLEIKLAIHETLADFNRRDDLNGWVPRNQAIDTDRLVDQMTRLSQEVERLTKENMVLKQQLAEISTTYNGLTLEEMKETLASQPVLRQFLIMRGQEQYFESGWISAGDNLLRAFWLFRDLLNYYSVIVDKPLLEILNQLVLYGLVEYEYTNQTQEEAKNLLVGQALVKTKLTDGGRNFLSRLMAEFAHLRRKE